MHIKGRGPFGVWWGLGHGHVVPTKAAARTGKRGSYLRQCGDPQRRVKGEEPAMTMPESLAWVTGDRSEATEPQEFALRGSEDLGSELLVVAVAGACKRK